jgi:hypothetical protein
MNASRRNFLRKITLPTLAAAGLLVLSRCQSAPEKKAPAAPAKTNCSDLSMLTQEELNVRQQFGYESPSSATERQCGNCALYIIPSAERPCGGCMLFKGPVTADGSCIQFAAKVQQ